MPPKRPRQHQLEQESLNAFRSALPDEWLFRELGQDYGIDGEVEIFSKGIATGKKFLVQLKGTDSNEVSKVLKISFSKEQGEYFYSFDLPVLIVRYQSLNKRVFAKWFHTFDPFYADKQSNSFTFSLSLADEWVENFHDNLAAELDAFRSIKSPGISTPVNFVIVSSVESQCTDDFDSLVSSLINSSRELSDIFHLKKVSGPVGALNSIEFDSKKIQIRLAGMNGFTLHMPDGLPEGEQCNFHYDIIIAIALSFHWHGHSHLGARIISRFGKLSGLNKDMHLLMEMSICLAKAYHFSAAMELSEALFDEADLITNAQMLMNSVLLKHRNKLSIAEKEFAYSVLQKMARKAENIDQRLASVLQYNSGNLLITSKRYREGVRHYILAAKLEPDYYERGYFWKELAGVFFDKGRYKLAAKAYACAFELDPDNLSIKPLLADSLFFSGDYRQAKKYFKEFIGGNTETFKDLEWQLKHYVLEHIVDELGINKQKRQPALANALYSETKIEDNENAVEAATQAIHLDALHALSWFNLGVNSNTTADLSSAAKSFLISALLTPHDLEAWYNVLAVTHTLNDNCLFASSFAVAYYYNNEEFVSFLSSKLNHETDAEPFLAAIEELALLLNKLYEDGDSGEVRVHLPEGGFDLLVEK